MKLEEIALIRSGHGVFARAYPIATQALVTPTGKHKGTYTQRYQVTFGRLDNRGVLQGMTAKDAMIGGREDD